MTLPKRLRAAREAAGLSTRALDRAAGLSQGVTSRIESGLRPCVGAGTIQSLAGTLNVTSDFLLGGNDPNDEQAGTLKSGAGLGDRILESLSRIGISQNELERRARIGRGYISQIASGARGKRISSDVLSRIAGALNESQEWLLFGGPSTTVATSLGESQSSPPDLLNGKGDGASFATPTDERNLPLSRKSQPKDIRSLLIENVRNAIARAETDIQDAKRHLAALEAEMRRPTGDGT
jgi:transcriptional regulator with XRE-family HTH domain